ANVLCASDGGYVGAAVCATCHAAEHQKWSGARHSKMLQPATKTSVRGDFTRGKVQLRGQAYALSAQDGAYYITETYLTGRALKHRVDYTLGSRRIQHYLTTLPDGRIVVLPPSWDVTRHQWFHNFDIGDPDESGEIEVQLWNKACFSCHVSQEEKNFDPEKVEYKTAWLDFGVNCERCHGPGKQHVADYSAQPKPAAPVHDILMQTRLDAARNTMVCAQCHSFRDIFVPGFRAGDDYYDHFVPVLEYSQPVDKDPAYWPDGRTRRFSTDAFGLWQSQCFLKGGLTCLKCHVDPHDTSIETSPQLRPDSPAICTQCHAAIGKAISAHTHHAEKSAGSSCVECHMPRTVLSIKAKIRDHAITIPVPENTARHEIPNACNECHPNRDANWAIKNMDRWWGSGSRANAIRRADAFAAARAKNAAAVSDLLAVASDSKEGPFARANALGYLSNFASDPRVPAMFVWALGDSHPLVRVTAALRMPQAAKATADLRRALRDRAATVRLAAAVSLAGRGLTDLPGEDRQRFVDAAALYAERANLNVDDADQNFAAGRFFLLTGKPVRAAQSLANALRLNSGTPARYFLAYALAEQGKYDEARAMLRNIQRSDPQYDRAQALLQAIGSR
ncbi:MAG: ammonia-forming cytochrome c nitrite reductase subunit c552, partial [Acidobacteriaceae bacterium]|nr:ammonia-forming cytochrome c nitrite reductase subunit c552 [Acidobacteriaceae bacterium]